jgi:hypothetical protein
MKLKYPVYAIIWDDAESDSSWREEHEISLKPTLAMTFGFLLAQNDDYVIIGDSYFLEGKVISNTTKIPRGMIKSMTEVTVKEKKVGKKKENLSEEKAPIPNS